MPLDLITIQELLRDPQYKAFFTKPPKLPSHYGPENKPWKLFILKPGESAWRSKRFSTYRDAFAGFKKLLPSIENAAINCPPLTFMPPIKNFRVKGKFTDKAKKKPLIKSRVWTPQLEADMGDHNWCPHCRRPTIFIMASKAIGKGANGTIPSLPSLRCCICGASERIVDLRHPENHEQWNPNRTEVHP